MPKEAVDRRKPILVLCTWSMWTDDLRTHIGDRYRLQIPTDTRMRDLDRLSEQRSWRLVLMASVDTVTDQKHPLDALRRWSRPHAQPVVILSPFPTPIERRDAMLAGAIWYAELPWIPEDINAVLHKGLGLARQERLNTTNRLGANNLAKKVINMNS